jgi:hypothetical protein
LEVLLLWRRKEEEEEENRRKTFSVAAKIKRDRLAFFDSPPRCFISLAPSTTTANSIIEHTNTHLTTRKRISVLKYPSATPNQPFPPSKPAEYCSFKIP